MCSHQQDLGYKGFIANIIICEKSFCPVMVFPAELLEDYSHLCPRRSNARLLLLTPGAVLQQCKAAPFIFCPPAFYYHNKIIPLSEFRGQFGDKLETSILLYR